MLAGFIVVTFNVLMAVALIYVLWNGHRADWWIGYDIKKSILTILSP